MQLHLDLAKLISLGLLLFGPLAMLPPDCPAAPSLINSLSQKQELSVGLGSWGVPACVLVGRQRPRGLYVTAVVSRGLGVKLGLEAGDVLLSMNGRVIDSAPTADRIITNNGPGTIRAVVARVAGNRVNVLTLSATMDEVALRVMELASGQSRSQAGASASAAGANAKPAKPEEPSQELSSSLEAYMLELVNADRAQNGLGSLKHSTGLGKLARDYALYIQKTNHFAHEDLEGLEPKDRARRAGLNIVVWENLAWRGAAMSYKDLVKLCQTDMMSEPADVPTNHRGCILNAKHQTVGIGIITVAPHKVICVQEFSPDEVP